MSCQLCYDRQEALLLVADLTFYRWKHANIGMVGCNEHLREIFAVLSKAQTKVQ